MFRLRTLTKKGVQCPGTSGIVPNSTNKLSGPASSQQYVPRNINKPVSNYCTAVVVKSTSICTKWSSSQ